MPINLPDSNIIIPVVGIPIVITLVTYIWKDGKDKGKAIELAILYKKECKEARNYTEDLDNRYKSSTIKTEELLTLLRDEVKMLRGVLIGIDGQNGIRGEMKSNFKEFRELRHQVNNIDNLQKLMVERQAIFKREIELLEAKTK